MKNSKFCVPPDTLIFTNSFTPINETKLHCRGSQGQQQLILERKPRHHVGEMIGITPMGFPTVFITPEHEIKIKRFINEGHSPESFDKRIQVPSTWIDAEDVKKRDLLIIPKPMFEEKYIDEYIYPADRNLFEALGWYVSEGHRDWNRLIFSQKNTETLNHIKTLVRFYFKEFKIIKSGNDSHQLTCLNAEMSKQISSDFGEGAKNKHLPHNFYLYSEELLYSFLKGYILGDGCIVKNHGRIDLGTTSKQLALDLFALLLRLGYYPQFRKGTEQEKNFNGYVYMSFVYYVKICPADSEQILKKIDLYHLYSSEHKSHVRRYAKDEKYFYIPVKKIEQIPYEGEVWNLETEDNTYTLPFIVHNCYFHQPNQAKVRAQLAEAREARLHPPNEKHGFYTKTHKECDKCAFAEVCEFYEPGKKVCDFEIKRDIDLSSLQSIQDFAEELAKTEYQRYRKLTPFFSQNYENTELFEVSSRTAKRLMSLLKDYANIKELYEKRNKVTGWDQILRKEPKR